MPPLALNSFARSRVSDAVSGRALWTHAQEVAYPESFDPTQESGPVAPDRRGGPGIAEAQRDRRRAEDRSKRPFLTEIHHAYDFPGAPARTIRAHRRHALEDINRG
jgi:hypothetical protein